MTLDGEMNSVRRQSQNLEIPLRSPQLFKAKAVRVWASRISALIGIIAVAEFIVENQLLNYNFLEIAMRVFSWAGVIVVIGSRMISNYFSCPNGHSRLRFVLEHLYDERQEQLIRLVVFGLIPLYFISFIVAGPVLESEYLFGVVSLMAMLGVIPVIIWALIIFAVGQIESLREEKHLLWQAFCLVVCVTGIVLANYNEFSGR